MNYYLPESCLSLRNLASLLWSPDNSWRAHDLIEYSLPSSLMVKDKTVFLLNKELHSFNLTTEHFSVD